jgi:hypothetical protein
MSREMAHKVIVPKKNCVPKLLKQWYIGNFMYPSAAVVCCCVYEEWGGLLDPGSNPSRRSFVLQVLKTESSHEFESQTGSEASVV